MNRTWTALKRSVYIFFYSLTFIPFLVWLRFWFTFENETPISLDGLRVYMRTGSMRSKIVDLYMAVGDILWRQYEQPDYKLSKDAVVLEIGSHIGSFALLASIEAGRVITFEPDKRNFDILKKNIEANGATNITAVNKAVSDTTGKILLYKDERNSAAHSIVTGKGVAEEVESLSLNDMFDNFGIETCHFMKLDCEGAEFAILRGTSLETLRKIKRISMEYHEGYALEDLLDILTNSGFEITKNEPDTAYQGQIWAKR
ncbi:FkbM family methyltransferase [Candidatus Parcubacteria bacterium]|nr:FkbM family methyltransferase [Candidatus Parcubacteria bacterium]